VSDDRIDPPAERYRHGKIVSIPALREDKAGGGHKEKAGEVIPFNLWECSLDQMYDRGHLGGRQEDAERRYSAGLWLRQLYLSVAGSVGVAAYHDAWNAYDPRVDGMSDQDAWNFKVLWDTRKQMKHHWRPLECVCILDRRYKQAWPALHTALDVLSDYRPEDLRNIRRA
jgi:hypothetical protein